jgi:hypothetical protein
MTQLLEKALTEVYKLPLERKFETCLIFSSNNKLGGSRPVQNKEVQR